MRSPPYVHTIAQSQSKLKDNKKTMCVLNKKLMFDLNLNSDEIKAKLTNSNFNFNIPSSKIFTNISSVDIDIDKNKIFINPFDFIYNKNSKIILPG